MGMNDAQAFCNALKPYIQQIDHEENKNVVRMESAVVKEVDNAAKTCKVLLSSSPDRADQIMLLPNKTGKDLSVGETVWVMMWGRPAFTAIVFMDNLFDNSIR